MKTWEQRITGAFAARAAARFAAGGEEGRLRLRSRSIFPGFDAAPPDEKESYLEAAEALEERGVLSITWEKRGRGERIKTLLCEDLEKLFEEAGRGNPRLEAEEIRVMIRDRLPGLGGLSECFDAAALGRGMDRRAAEDLAVLLEFIIKSRGNGAGEKLSTRALSVKLFRDSKRLEQVIALGTPLLAAARKQGVPVPDLSFLERSFPEVFIAGRLAFEYFPGGPPPLINEAGLALGFPLSAAALIGTVRTLSPREEPLALTVENKETFYALGPSNNSDGPGRGAPPPAGVDCCLYVGGYPNRAAAVLIKALAASGFRFLHAGDLDPDGILILQNIAGIAGKPVAPLRMDPETFDRYLPFARPLGPSSLRQFAKIREDTRFLPGIADLIRRIEETRRGVEQEIIDYGENS